MADGRFAGSSELTNRPFAVSRSFARTAGRSDVRSSVARVDRRILRGVADRGRRPDASDISLLGAGTGRRVRQRGKSGYLRVNGSPLLTSTSDMVSARSIGDVRAVETVPGEEWNVYGYPQGIPREQVASVASIETVIALQFTATDSSAVGQVERRRPRDGSRRRRHSWRASLLRV